MYKVVRKAHPKELVAMIAVKDVFSKYWFGEVKTNVRPFLFAFYNLENQISFNFCPIHIPYSVCYHSHQIRQKYKSMVVILQNVKNLKGISAFSKKINSSLVSIYLYFASTVLHKGMCLFLTCCGHTEIVITPVSDIVWKNEPAVKAIGSYSSYSRHGLFWLAECNTHVHT